MVLAGRARAGFCGSARSRPTILRQDVLEARARGSVSCARAGPLHPLQWVQVGFVAVARLLTLPCFYGVHYLPSGRARSGSMEMTRRGEDQVFEDDRISDIYHVPHTRLFGEKDMIDERKGIYQQKTLNSCLLGFILFTLISFFSFFIV